MVMRSYDFINGPQTPTAPTAGTPSAADDLVTVSYAQSLNYQWGGTVGGTADAITLTPTPAITSYNAGVKYAFVATGTNTGAATVAVSGLAAKDIKKQDGTALVAGDIVSGKLYFIIYEGTNFRFISSADVAGASSSTDNALVRFDGTSGKVLQNSLAVVDDAGALSGLTQLDVDNIRVDLNTISSTNTNGNLNLTPNGTGDLVLDGLKWPQTDGTLGQIIQTNGAGQLSFVTQSGSSVNQSVRVRGQNGYGSTNTKIRRFTTTDYTNGSDITYADSATNGASFTINSDGLYSIDFIEQHSGSAVNLRAGISLNASSLGGTEISGLPLAEILACIGWQSSNPHRMSMSITRRFSNGDVIRPHNGGGGGNLPDGTDGLTSVPSIFVITKIGA